MTNHRRQRYRAWGAVCLAVLLPSVLRPAEPDAPKSPAKKADTKTEARTETKTEPKIESRTATKPPESPSTNQVIDRALRFIVDDAAKWRKDKTCATCHHGTMTVWALSEAKQQGYTVDPAAIDENLAWSKSQWSQ